MFFLAAALLIRCNSTHSTAPDRSKSNIISNDLHFKIAAPDTTEIIMAGEYAICCGIWESGYIDKPTLKIWIYDPLNKIGGWKLFILVDEASQDTVHTLPTDEAGSAPVSMFAFNPISNKEWNSNTRQSRGSITVHSIDCGPPVRVNLSIDAELGSEYEGTSALLVTGSFSAVIYNNPSPAGCDFGF